MTADLRARLDGPIRFALWSVVVVVGVVAIEPTILDLPGSPLVGIAAVAAHLALARLAVGLTADGLARPVPVPIPHGEAGTAMAAAGVYVLSQPAIGAGRNGTRASRWGSTVAATTTVIAAALRRRMVPTARATMRPT